MSSTDIYNKLRPVIQNYLPDDVSEADITMESDLAQELNISSAYFVDIILDIEDAFDIEFQNEEIENFQTVGDAVNVIKSKLTA